MIIAINPNEKFVVNGNEKAGVTVSQGDGVIFLPPEVLAEITAKTSVKGFTVYK